MKRVLIVEDEPFIAMDLAHLLTEAEFTVVGPAARSAEGLELIEREGCDVAILDVNLGRETSEPVARELIARSVPFVTLSGYAGEQHPQVFRSATLLTKPVRFEHLLIELRRLLAQQRIASSE